MIKKYEQFVESLKSSYKLTINDIKGLSENFEYYISDNDNADVEVLVSKEEFIEYGSKPEDKLNIDIQDNKVIGKLLQKNN